MENQNNKPTVGQIAFSELQEKLYEVQELVSEIFSNPQVLSEGIVAEANVHVVPLKGGDTKIDFRLKIIMPSPNK